MREVDKSGPLKVESTPPERWERIKEILGEILDLPPLEREPAILNACRGDSSLEHEVRELLAQTIGPAVSAADSESAAKSYRATTEWDRLIQAGTLVAGRFRMVRPLGRGGMGQVWEAFDDQLKVSVALKTLRPELLEDSRAVERFHRELLIARGVTHRNICRVYDLSFHDMEGRQIPFLSMQLIQGESLAERLKRGRVPEAEATMILEHCASALEAAHRAGVIHRDFKPGNVMLSTDDSGQLSAVVMDFGLARGTRTEGAAFVTAAGTPGYMPPEQVAGKEVQPSADVYSFAVVACELLTGLHPFNGGLKALSRPWRSVIRKALDVEPCRRIPTPLALLRAVKTRKRRGVPLVGGAAATAVLAMAALWATGLNPFQPREATVAVLPFEVGPQDANLQYLGDGIAEELINSMTRQPRLRVIAKGSAFRFRGRTGDLKGASKALGVKYVVVGSVRRQSGHVRIGVELVDPNSSFQLWASTFDRPEDEVFEVHEMVATEIALRVGSLLNRPRAPRQLPTINPLAHDLYLRGLFHVNHRTRDETLLALDLFQTAIQKAPDYAPLYTSLADCYSVLGDYRIKPPLEIAGLAHAAIQQALRLDPNLAEAHASMGLWANLYGWDNKLSEASFLNAIRLSPGYAPAHQWYSQLLYKTRRFDEAGREARRALELDPISAAVNLNYGNLFYYSRDYAALVRQSARQHELNPSLPFATHHKALGLAYLGRTAEAIATMEAAKPILQENDALPIRIWAEILAVAGDQHRARESLDRLLLLHEQGVAPASFPAMIYATLGEPEKACDYLEKAVEERDTNLTLLDVAPPYDSLRKNPRFLAVRAKLFKETTATY